MSKELVFCSTCKWIEEVVGRTGMRCVHPGNLEETQHDFYRTYYHEIATPKARNASNDCGDYKAK